MLELYPGPPEHTTGRLRLGLTVPATERLIAGDHRPTDPDGRVVTAHAIEPEAPHRTR